MVTIGKRHDTPVIYIVSIIYNSVYRSQLTSQWITCSYFITIALNLSVCLLCRYEDNESPAIWQAINVKCFY